MTTTRKVLGSASRLHSTVNTRTTIYTVPALTQAVVECIDIHNFGTGVDCGFGILVGTAEFTLEEMSVLGFNQTLSWRGKHFLSTGQHLYMFGAAGATLSLWASGYEIT